MVSCERIIHPPTGACPQGDIVLMLTPGPTDICPFAPDRIANGLTLKSAWLAYKSKVELLQSEIANGRRPANSLSNRLVLSYQTTTKKLGDLIATRKVL